MEDGGANTMRSAFRSQSENLLGAYCQCLIRATRYFWQIKWKRIGAEIVSALCSLFRILDDPNSFRRVGLFRRKSIDAKSSVERAKRSVGMRYVLHADISRFYPSIYTHSIPWAIHGKGQRGNRGNDLYGNLLDLWVRETQSQQTGGLPVGPDTSFLLAEVIASSIDDELQQSLGGLHGTRYIDDYHLYFKSRAEADRGLAELHRIAGVFELEINDLKTAIQELPEAIEPLWKSQLRAISSLFPDDHATSLRAVFDLAAEFARSIPSRQCPYVCRQGKSMHRSGHGV